MTADNHTTRCADIFGLLQPFVDSELTDSERTIVVEHLETCPDCLAQIQLQQRVRAALKQLTLEPAPASLRVTILAELDRIDASSGLMPNTDQIATSFGSKWTLFKERMQAFVRGGLVMLPASVAAVGLFFGIQYSFDSIPNSSPRSFSGSLEQLPLPARPFLNTNDNPPSPPPPLPPDVELISTSPDGASYRHHGLGLRVLDNHRHPRIRDNAGNFHHVGNQSYRLSRDDRGWPVIQFEHNKVLHTLVFENAPARLVNLPIEANAPDFRSLLDLAGALAKESVLPAQK